MLAVRIPILRPQVGQSMLVSTIGFGCMPPFRIFLCRRQLGGKIAEEVVQHLFPLGLVVRNLVEAILHLRGKNRSSSDRGSFLPAGR